MILKMEEYWYRGFLEHFPEQYLTNNSLDYNFIDIPPTASIWK